MPLGPEPGEPVERRLVGLDVLPHRLRAFDCLRGTTFLQGKGLRVRGAVSVSWFACTSFRRNQCLSRRLVSSTGDRPCHAPSSPRGDKRYVRRKKGKFTKSQDDMGRSHAADRRRRRRGGEEGRRRPGRSEAAEGEAEEAVRPSPAFAASRSHSHRSSLFSTRSRNISATSPAGSQIVFRSWIYRRSGFGSALMLAGVGDQSGLMSNLLIKMCLSLADRHRRPPQVVSNKPLGGGSQRRDGPSKI